MPGIRLHGEAHVHVLDDLTGFSARAIDLLTRTGRREPETSDRTPTDFLRVRTLSGRTIPAPMELVIRREGFHAKYRGLRYDVRSSLTFDGERRDFVRTWEFDLDGNIWADERGCISRGPANASRLRSVTSSTRTDGLEWVAAARSSRWLRR